MNNFAHMMDLVFVTAIACAGQAAWSQTSSEAPAAENAEVYLNVAAIGQAAERHKASEAQIAPKRQSLLEEMGLAGDAPFPSRAGLD